MGKIISINPEFNCLMARTMVDLRKFKGGLFSGAEIDSVFPKVGYSVYYNLDGIFNKLDFDLSNLKVALNNKDKVYIVGIYWIRDNMEITVPVGIPKSKTGGDNGVCKIVTISISDSHIEQFIATILGFETASWKVEQRDGFVYEYLMEYYIDSNGEQKGFSLGLRDIIKNSIIQKDSTVKKNEELKNAIESIELFKNNKFTIEVS